MAYVCPHCRVIHPRDAFSCKDAREIINRESQEMRIRREVHLDNCPGCPDPERHIRNIRDINNPHPRHPRYIGSVADKSNSRIKISA